jgi:hypothetical protein
MSDIPPSQSMLIPDGSPSIPELRYDGAGNAYAHNHVGNWVSHPGIACAVTQVQWPEDRISQPYKVSSFNRSLSFTTRTYHFAAMCSYALVVWTHNFRQLLPAS